MEGFIAIGLLMLLMIIGVPVAWSFAGVLAYMVYAYDGNLNTLMMQGYRSVDSVILIALPLFVLTGYLMQSGGIARRLVDFIEVMIGKRRGGMGASMVVASGIFGAIAGTATAAVASIGTIMIGPLEKRGYPRSYSSALLGISSLLGILIPPSITMILFAVVTRQSVAACFAASVGPALLLIIGLILANRFSVGRFFEEVSSAAGDGMEQLPGKGKAAIKAFPALSLPIIILGGIYGGVFTPTEAAAVAAFAAMLIGFFIYRDLNLKSFARSVVAAAETTGTVILILLFSFMIGRILASERIPQDLRHRGGGTAVSATDGGQRRESGALRFYRGLLRGDRRQQPAGGTDPLHGLPHRQGVDPQNGETGPGTDGLCRAAGDDGYHLCAGTLPVPAAPARVRLNRR